MLSRDGRPGPGSRAVRPAGLAVAGVVLAAAFPAPAAAFDRAEAERLARSLGTGTSLVVVDREGRRLAAVRPATRRPLASLTKLFTVAAVVLERVPAPRTTVELTGAVGSDGTLAGDVVLRGGGDVRLGDAGLRRLRDAVLAAGVRRVTGRVVGDGTRFDAATGGPATRLAFDPEFGGALGALTYDRGRATPGGPFQRDPAAAAAARFDDLLEAAGVTLPLGPASGAVPRAPARLASVTGDVAALRRDAGRASDPLAAEALGKLVAVHAGRPGTTADAAAEVAAVVRRRLGVRAALGDAAGFVRTSRASALDVAKLMRRMRTRPAFVRSLASGGTGTLRGRKVPARCRAKTGTLRDARTTTLAGVCGGRSFAVLTTGRSTARARAVQDRIARVVGR